MTEYSEITHPINIKILKTILSESKNLTDIASELNISRPEISRQLAKLRKISLVEKEENLNSISPLGSLILEILAPIDFILLHYEFFQQHPFINFPLELLYGIDQLRNSKLIIGTGTILQKYIECANLNHRNLKLILNTPIPNIANIVYEQGTIIVPSNATSPILKSDQISKVIKRYEIRKLSEINYDLALLDDKYGFIYFPDKFGQPDNNACFFIDDSNGVEFLFSLWSYFLARSTLFSN